MAIMLRHLEKIDHQTALEHRAWLEEHLQLLPDLSRQKILAQSDNAFSVLSYPRLWSGARFSETSIKPHLDRHNEPGSSASKPVSELIDVELAQFNKELNKEDPRSLAVALFKKKYQKYQRFLYERSLLSAINHSLDLLTSNDPAVIVLKELITNFYKLKTRQECLEMHAGVAALTKILLRSPAIEPEQGPLLKQAEVLAKRLLDIHIRHIKKFSVTERIFSNISTISSSLGLLAGIPAAFLGIAGIFFPPLLLPAAILGTISFASYVSTAITASKITYEGLAYGRAPATSEVLSVAVDLAIAPFNFLGGSIFSSLKNLLGHGKKMIDSINGIWNNILSNIFPDIFYADDVIKDIRAFTLPHQAYLKNTTSATTWNNVTSNLIKAHDAATAIKIKQQMKQCALGGKSTSLDGHDFVLVSLPAKTDKILNTSQPKTVSSYHAHILTWSSPLFTLNNSKLAQLKEAHQSYRALPHDANASNRLMTLQTLSSACTQYLGDPETTDLKTVDLLEKVNKELNTLNSHFNNNTDQLLLVGQKSP